MAKKESTETTARKIGGPFLAAAVICDSIMDDRGGRFSAIGISDGLTFYIPHDAPPGVPSETQPVLMALNILIIFRSGDSPGKHKLMLVVQQPSGKRIKGQELELNLSEPPHGGSNVKTGLHVPIYDSGLYWIDVVLDGKRFTRMPYNVKFQRLPAPEGSAKKKRSG